MSILLTIIVVLTLVELVRIISELLEWGNELPRPDIDAILAERYHPEECDEKMKVECQALLEDFFKEPSDLPMYLRIEHHMKGMSSEQKKVLIEQITQKTSSIMGVNIASVNFENSQSMGAYHLGKNSLMVSEAYLEFDECNVEIIKTIFHELKHAVQFKAITPGGNIWGYSEETLIAWANNFQDYINYMWDPEGYILQAIETDSFGFECSVIPKPGFSSQGIKE